MRTVCIAVCLFLISVEGYSGTTGSSSYNTDPILQKVDKGLTKATTTTTSTNVITPIDGSTFDLSYYPNYFIKAEVTPSSHVANITDVRFQVAPPNNYGVLVVIHSITLRSGVPIIGTGKNGCFEYVTFSSTVKNTHLRNKTSFACGSITDTVQQLVGFRTFLTGINESLNIHVHFNNEEFLTSIPENVNNTKSTFILDITAYSDCSTKFKSDPEEFVCQSDICVPSALKCDLNFNCVFDTTSQNDERQTTKDELNCQRETDLNGGHSSSASPSFQVQPNSEFLPEEETTTTNPVLIIHYYDHDSSDDFLERNENRASWARQLPFSIVIVIFLFVSFLIFGICFFMAKVNDKLFTATMSSIRRRRSQLGSTAQHNTEDSSPEDTRISLHPIDTTITEISSSQTPSYEESTVECPPSYNTLFQSNQSQIP